MKRWINLAALTGAALCVFCGPVAAQQTAAPITPATTYGELSEDQKISVIDAALRQGNLVLTRAFLDGTEFTDPDAMLKARYLRGGLLKSEGRLEEAAALFRELLAEHPELDQVRSELAHTLFVLGDDDAARHHFELLQAAAVGADSGEQFRRFIDGIDARRPFSARLSVSLAPGTNVNSGTDATVFNFQGVNFSTNPESRKQSGLGLKVNADAAYTWRFGRFEPYVGGGAALSDYKGIAFDDLNLSGRGGARLRFGSGSAGLEAVATRRFFAGDPYSWEFGPRLYGTKRFSNAMALNGSVSAKRRLHDDVERRDAWTFSADATLTRALATGLTIAPSLGIDLERVPDLSYFSFSEIEPGFAVYWEGPLAITAQAQAKLALRDYEAEFPGQGNARDDRRLTLSLALIKRDFQWQGFAPVISYTYTNNDSDVVLYEYDRHDFSFAVTRKF